MKKIDIGDNLAFIILTIIFFIAIYLFRTI